MKKYSLNRKTKSEKIVFTVVNIFLIFWTITLLYPLFFGFNAALKENGRAFMADPVSIVIFDSPHFENFILAFKEISYNEVSYFQMILNSLFFATIPNLTALFFTFSIAYICCKYQKYRILKYLYSFILFIQFIPLYGSTAGTYKLFKDLGFINSYSISFASMGISFGYFLYAYAFFKGLSWSYAESAFIDGAGHWQTYLRIMLPQVIPSMLVLFILMFIGSWNDFSTCQLYYYEKIPTLSFGIYAFYNKTIYMANQPVYMAGCFIASIPSMVLFLIFQDEIMSKVQISGLKG